MRDRPYSWIFTAVLVLMGFSIALTGSVAAQSTGYVDVDASNLTGDGTADNPYLITNSSELQAIEDDLDANYRLKNNIDATVTSEWNNGSGFDPIGENGFRSRFTGELSGSDNEIKGLYIHRPSQEGIGLFGAIGENSNISNISLKSVNFTGENNIGGIAGANTGVISQTSVSGNINATISESENNAGGLVGNNDGGTLSSSSDGTIINSTSSVNVSGSGYNVGGIAGSSDGKILRSSATGLVSGSSTVGGLVGVSFGTITNSSATGLIEGTDDNLGGLVGEAGGTVNNSYATGNVAQNTGFGDRVGGLVGDNSATIINSNASGNVMSQSGDTGGLIGRNHNSLIKSSYATGNVTATNENVGGLVGSNNGGTITQSHAVGDVVSNKSAIGGLVGKNRGVINQSYAKGSVTASVNVNGFLGGGIGGLVGRNIGDIIPAKINQSYATGDVDGKNINIGGLVGENEEGEIMVAYATGDVSGDVNIGGLIGQNNGGSVNTTYAAGTTTGNGSVGGLIGRNDGVINTSYWDKNRTKQKSSSGGTGLTTTQMVGNNLNQSLRNDFDFTHTWETVTNGSPPAASRNGYPILQNLNATPQILTPTIGTPPAPMIRAPADDSYDPSLPFTVGTSFNASGVISSGDVAVAIVNVTAENNTRVAINNSLTIPVVSSSINTTIPAGSLSGDVQIETRLLNDSSGSVYATDTLNLTASRTTTRRIKLSNVSIEPALISSTGSTHMLSFDVANLSADGEEDNFTISLPNSVTVEEASVTNAGTLDPEDLNPENPIEFSVNPESQIQDPVSMTVELQLSAGSD